MVNIPFFAGFHTCQVVQNFYHQNQQYHPTFFKLFLTTTKKKLYHKQTGVAIQDTRKRPPDFPEQSAEVLSVMSPQESLRSPGKPFVTPGRWFKMFGSLVVSTQPDLNKSYRLSNWIISRGKDENERVLCPPTRF